MRKKDRCTWHNDEPREAAEVDWHVGAFHTILAGRMPWLPS